MSPRIIHYSATPLLAVRSRPHDASQCGAYKTSGLWVSIEGEDDWLAWCRSEGYGSYAYATEIILKPDNEIMWLRGADEIDDFTSRYLAHGQLYPGSRSIDWLQVRNKCTGLIIAPYCWERRLARDTFWYYGWDCASGVIWDARAVTSVAPLPLPDFGKKESA